MVGNLGGLVSLAIGLMSSLALGDAWTPGNYTGHGVWRDTAGHSGLYEVVTVLTADSMSSNYAFAEGVAAVSLSLQRTGDGFYSLIDAEKTSGNMYCYDVQCHYELGAGSVEETLSFVDGKLYKLGSKLGSDGRTIIWQEALNQQ